MAARLVQFVARVVAPALRPTVVCRVSLLTGQGSMARFGSNSRFSFVCLLVLAPIQVAAQPGVISLVLGAGQDFDPGDRKVGAAELRWETRSPGLTPVLMGGVQVAENDCADSLPPICTFPGAAGVQFRAGFSAPAELGPVHLTLIPTAGTVRWGGGWDRSLRLDAVVRIGLRQGAQFEVGARQEWLWISRRTAEVVTRGRRVDLVGLVLGLRFAPRRQEA